MDTVQGSPHNGYCTRITAQWILYKDHRTMDTLQGSPHNGYCTRNTAELTLCFHLELTTGAGHYNLFSFPQPTVSRDCQPLACKSA